MYNLYLNKRPVQIGTNLYKSLPLSELVQVCTAKIFPHKKPLQISINLSLTVSWYKYVQYKSLSLSHQQLVPICANLSLTVSWYKYEQSLSHSKLVPVRTVQISLPPEAGANAYKTLPHSTVSWYKYIQYKSPSNRRLV